MDSNDKLNILKQNKMTIEKLNKKKTELREQQKELISQTQKLEAALKTSIEQVNKLAYQMEFIDTLIEENENKG